MTPKEKKCSLVILHFQPLERFPPVINLLNFLKLNALQKIIVISTINKKSTLKIYKDETKKLAIKRTPAIHPPSVLRVFNYLRFYLYSLYLILKNKPSAVLYFETLSSWPALVYKKLKGDKVKLLVHYHEYTSPHSYRNNMRLVKRMHGWETRMYRNSYEWISHTNEVRLEKFRNDHNLQEVNSAVFHIMPNYPSRSWASVINETEKNQKIRLVFVGSLGYDNMYLQETIDWVLQHKDFFSLDFYAYNIDRKAKDLLNSLQDDCIQYHGGCDYEHLPAILKNYDVGLVMYKPFSYNTVNAVSNKLFEYLACGLDTWFSTDMTYTYKYIREDAYPKIIAVDFKQLHLFDFRKALSRKNLAFGPDSFFYENVYPEILGHICNDVR